MNLTVADLVTTTTNATNITITVPANSHLYGNQLCTPPSWTDVLTFYLSNYVVHVATVQSYPGERFADSIMGLIAALLFPVAGVGKGLDRLIRCACRGKTKLEKAARAGALCMVTRNRDWRPQKGDQLKFAGLIDPSVAAMSSITELFMRIFAKFGAAHEFKPTGGSLQVLSESDGMKAVIARIIPFISRDQKDGSTWWEYLGIEIVSILAGRDVHGMCTYETSGGLRNGLPEGYELKFVPHDACVRSIEEENVWTTVGGITYSSVEDVKGSSNFVSGVASIIQLLFGLTTLYASVGPQLTYYGYAAFGLTVLPYTIISLVNFCAALVTPSYNSVYIVESEVMHEAMSRGAKFTGVVGRLIPEDTEPPTSASDPDQDQPATFVICSVQDFIKSYFPEESSDNSSSLPKTAVADSHPALLSPRSDISTFTIHYHTHKTLAIDYTNFDIMVRDNFLLSPNHPALARHRKPFTGYLQMQETISSLIRILLGVLPLIPIGVLTHFRSAHATLTQRVVVLLWFAFGVLQGAGFAAYKPLPTEVREYEDDGDVDWDNIHTLTMLFKKDWARSAVAWDEGRQKLSDFIGKGVRGRRDAERKGGGKADGAGKTKSEVLKFRITTGILMAVFAAPAVAGFVIVGLMFADFGTCSTIG